ncbi:nuclear transport factor 2 family protein [Streptomyces sp. NPDC090112]|uniref:nuclear transport factor 2 family protein n=1 Tax=Streptomyces sp. NPDC090112 TaxID=3365949 RepID=UPI00382843C9
MMFVGRRGVVGAAVAAVVAGVTTSVAALPAGGEAARGDCPEARTKVERLEGRITPNACAFMRRQIAFGELPTGAPPAVGDLSHPRVKAYLDIFDEDATLWEAGSPPQRGHSVIGTSITGSLRLVPDLRYRGTDVVADGGVMMFGQWNEATLKGHKVAYPQIARNVLGDDGKSLQARRYYDRYALFRDTVPEMVPKGLFDGIADSGPAPSRGRTPEPVRAAEIPDRLAAWNGEDVDALLARTGNARLSGPGLGAPLATEAGKRAYLQRFFGTADVRFKAGQVAFGGTTTYVEWHGTVSGPKGKDIPFGIVERFGSGGEWELYFDTLPLVADQVEIGALFQKLAQP